MRCCASLRLRFRTLKWIWDEVQLEVTRQSQHSGPSEGIGKSTEKPLYFNDHAAEYARRLMMVAHRYSARQTVAVTTPQRLLWASDNVFSLYRADGAISQCWVDVLDMIQEGMRLLDRPPRLYLGDCPACTEQIFGDAEQEQQRCRTCLVVVDTVELRADTHIRARAMYVTPSEAQRVLGQIYGVQITRKRITQWHRRGKVHPVMGNRYLVDDLLKVAVQHSRT